MRIFNLFFIIFIQNLIVGCSHKELTMKPFQSELKEISTMLVVNNLTKSEKFYNDILGFETIESIEQLRRLRRDDFYLYLVVFSPPTDDKPNVTLANLNQLDKTNVNIIFRVKDCKKVYKELKEKGMQFLAEPHSPSWGGWRMFAKDPDGYLIEFEQPD
jgi:lactoylglutathione lyase